MLDETHAWSPLWFLLALAWALPVAAQPTSETQAASPASAVLSAPATDSEPAGYRDAVDRAVLEFAAGHFEESRSLFARAHALFANARTLRGLGMAEFELRHYVTALEHLEAALTHQTKPLDEELRKDTQRLIAQAHDYVGRYQLEVIPSLTRLTLDGAPHALPATALVLAMGEHVLEVEAGDQASERRRLKVGGGENQTLRFVFAKPAVSKETSTVTSPVDEPKSTRRWYKSPWLWTAVGVAAAGLAVGIAVPLSQRDADAAYHGTSNVGLKGPRE